MDNLETSERSLSVLCADLTNRDQLSKHVDLPEAMHAIARCEKRIRRAVEGCGGYLIDVPSGKLMAFFPDSVDALQAAIDMQRRVADLPPCSGVPLTIRVGVCTGHQLKEERYFPSDGANPAISLSAVADPGHILLSIPKRVKRFPWLGLAANRVPDLSLNCGNRQLGVFQVAWQEREPLALRMALAQLWKKVDGLQVRYRDKEIILNELQPNLKIGRESDCDLSIHDKRCSRHHGTIERRADQFFYVDRSSNGTYVANDGQKEVFVHRKEIPLSGCGHLSLGVPSTAKDVELVQFQVSTLLR